MPRANGGSTQPVRTCSRRCSSSVGRCRVSTARASSSASGCSGNAGRPTCGPSGPSSRPSTRWASSIPARSSRTDGGTVVAVDADHRFLLASPSGVTALVSSWGAGLVALEAPDRDGRFEDVVLGFDTVEEYRATPDLHLSATIGRVTGRIRDARYTFDGRTVSLPA